MRPLPQPLVIVAWLFILSGVCAAIEIVVALLGHRISLNFGVFNILIGYGLLRLNPRSLQWALFFTWLGIIFTPLAAVLFLFIPGTVKLFGLSLRQAPPGLGFVLSVAIFALLLWQLRVLTNPANRQLFV